MDLAETERERERERERVAGTVFVVHIQTTAVV